MDKDKALTVYLDPEDYAYLSHLAATQGTSMSGALRKLLADLHRTEVRLDNVSLGAMLDRSKERLADWGHGDIDLLEALMADRSEHTL